MRLCSKQAQRSIAHGDSERLASIVAVPGLRLARGSSGVAYSKKGGFTALARRGRPRRPPPCAGGKCSIWPNMDGNRQGDFATVVGGSSEVDCDLSSVRVSASPRSTQVAVIQDKAR